MIVIYLLILLSLAVAAGFLAAFIWSVRSGQYEDTCTPALRVLLDEPNPPAAPPESTQSTNPVRR